jgi:hypothetical protein
MSDIRTYPEWVDYWVEFHDNKWWHYQPDSTEFGPFNTRKEAIEDCIKQAPYFDNE